MPAFRITLLRLSLGATACAALLAGVVTPSGAAPASDTQGFIDSTARCAAPATAMAFGRTASSRVAICKSSGGALEYRGVRVRDGAKLILAASSSGGGVYTAENDGITYTVSSVDLTVSAGDTVIREEQMLEFHGPGSSDAPASSAPASPTPTTPLPPPLPAEVGGSDG